MSARVSRAFGAKLFARGKDLTHPFFGAVGALNRVKCVGEAGNPNVQRMLNFETEVRADVDCGVRF